MKYVYLSYSKYPQSCFHIMLAIALGAPSVLTYTANQKLTRANRRRSTSPYPTKPGYDRDEYPFACTLEGGCGASIMYISPSDNRGAGAVIGRQLRGCPAGTKFMIVITM